MEFIIVVGSELLFCLILIIWMKKTVNLNIKKWLSIILIIIPILFTILFLAIALPQSCSGSPDCYAGQIGVAILFVFAIWVVFALVCWIPAILTLANLRKRKD